MAIYTIQISNHKDAGSRLPTQEAGESWETKYDGPIASAKEARSLVDQLAKFYRHARAFRGNRTVGGRLWYAVLDMRAVIDADYPPRRCPTCGSHAPHLHPAVQAEGEVHICHDDFHKQDTPENWRHLERENDE